MFTNNPFAAAAQLVSAAFMHWFLIVMVLAVIAGTLFDIAHKGSAKYFFANWSKSRAKGSRRIGGGELASIAVQTALVAVMTSDEFSNQRPRLAHLLTMYGFVIYAGPTAILVFCNSAPGIDPLLWRFG